MKHFTKEIWHKHKLDLTSNHKAIGRLERACETLKRNLSAENVTESSVQLDNFLPGGGDFSSKLSRAKFEDLCKPLFDETIKTVEQTIKEASITKN